MNEDLYVINGKILILTSLLNDKEPSAETCDVTPEDFVKICEEMYNEGLISHTNFGDMLNAEVTDKGFNYFDNITNRLRI
ncbi:hypothetical protein [Priestia filamentosa]|uniref:hypothetical protein n=1 Tax=Priestia filamentosa TaxID=1402861 RepID=UPI0005895F3A|nr:hypothetical protein [Priestia filamentosa]MDT3766121.1 hypothetical protein [Priestia filamentosa]OXS65179.1 hypothetical protein B1B01_23720 [Priestia filamentosa]RJS62678.1 hypothetical protein CJ485_25130 [Priestia filamentosa]WRU97919.1 hypothetical protein RYX51_23340 [Priestia filamentosa]SMF71122.1 hypothetical protein SAMN06296056_11258 [Priestia filamentosa]